MTDEDFPTQLAKAKAGNVASQGWVGSYYFLNGDYENAVYWSKKAADAGNYRAQLYMAIAYERGEGVEKNLQKAFEYYSSSAKGGDVSAIYMLGEYYHTGEVVKQNLKKARNYYKIAAYNKLAVAQYRYARFCLAGVGGKKDFGEGVGSMQLAAQQGFNPAVVYLAVWYTYGYFVEQNEELGITLFELAAKQGSQEAQRFLGEFFFSGKHGCPKSQAVSAKWSEMAMENQDKEVKLSQIANNLAYCYAYGDDNLPQDFPKAHQTIDKAIEENVDEALEEAIDSDEFRKAVDEAYEEAHNEVIKAVDEEWDKIADRYELNDEGFVPVPVTVYEHFYREEDEDDHNDGVTDANVRIFRSDSTIDMASFNYGRAPETAARHHRTEPDVPVRLYRQQV